MAPKKKGERKRAGKQKQKTLPVLRRDVARQAIADSEGLKQKLADLEKELEKARGDKKDIYAEMIRQYQQLQCQTDAQIQHLKAKTENLQEQLGSVSACREDVRQSRADKAKALEEKDEAVAHMQSKINNMETEYEKILHGSLDAVLSKLQTAKLSWEEEATLVHLEYKDQLKEFGLNPLEI
ncbi:hypothetical protein lerEdw1_007626 [Lerista edwardsae]|nr:hypothetical protein lerEdw1_007626 [Lerista edwardsae]